MLWTPHNLYKFKDSIDLIFLSFYDKELRNKLPFSLKEV